MVKSSPLVLACTAAVTFPLALSAQSSAKIASAVSAAPPSISAKATVMDWDQSILREGSNSWTCLPDDPGTPGNEPACMDQTWMKWAQGYLNKQPPEVDRIGVTYMLAGDTPSSNTDPFATGPTADNEWLTDTHPHLMILVPDTSMLEGIPVHAEGGPWVMWRNTPYVHIMVPLSDGSGPLGG